MPATHQGAAKIPAVSGSSGRLIVQRIQEETEERVWPGLVFEDPALSYEEAMMLFVAASQEQPIQDLPDVPDSAKAAQRALEGEETQLRDDRRMVRQRHKLEDAAWKEARRVHKAAVEAYQALPREERHQQPEAIDAQDAQWRALRTQRRAMMETREQEDHLWRQERQRFRERWALLPVTTLWIAILVVVDNCTRQCLGLPLFVAGAHVTAELIAEALRVLLPPELQFLISDRGTHFRASEFKKRVLSETFIHVFTARHRPQSNGIAERFVRTLKEWLEDKSWPDDHELAALLAQFQSDYNDRPHQGLPLPGLSPNEFAGRIWLM